MTREGAAERRDAGRRCARCSGDTGRRSRAPTSSSAARRAGTPCGIERVAVRDDRRDGLRRASHRRGTGSVEQPLPLRAPGRGPRARHDASSLAHPEPSGQDDRVARLHGPRRSTGRSRRSSGRSSPTRAIPGARPLRRRLRVAPVTRHARTTRTTRSVETPVGDDERLRHGGGRVRRFPTGRALGVWRVETSLSEARRARPRRGVQAADLRGDVEGSRRAAAAEPAGRA